MLLVVVAAVGQAPINVSNLAQGKTAIATSGDATMAIDGNTSTRWEPNYSDEQTWQVDLGEDKTVKQIVILWEAAYSKGFTITGHAASGAVFTDDGYLNNGDEIYTVTNQALSDFPYTQVIKLNEAKSLRYIKFKSTARGTGYGNSFYEFYVLDTDADPYLYSCQLTASSYILKPGGMSNIIVDNKRDQFGGVINSETGLVLSVIEGKGTIENGVYKAPESAAGKVQIHAAMQNGGVADTYVYVLDGDKLTLDNEHGLWVGEGSNFYNSTEWKLVNDNSTDGGNHDNACFIYDLKGTYYIKTLKERYQDNATPVDYTISYSTDGETFTTLRNVTDYHSQNEEVITTVDGDVQARYIKFSCTKGAGAYGVIIKDFEIYGTNVSEVSNDYSGPALSSVSGTNIATTTADIPLNATDGSGKYLYYKIEQTTPSGGDTKTLHYTTMTSGSYTYHLTGLTPNTSYSFSITAYDVFGNECAAQTVSFTTTQLQIKSFTVTPSVISIPKGGDSSETPLSFKVIAEDDTDITDRTDITATEILNSGDLVHVVSYSTTENYFTAITGVNEGHGDYRFTATFGSSTVTADVEIFVYETDLKIWYKLNEGDDYSGEHSGEIGKLDELVNKSITDDKKTGTYQNVYSLKVVGNINDADIKTLRHMAGGTDNATSDASLGNLHVLDLAGVKFAAAPSYAADLPDDATAEQIANQQTARSNNCFVTAVDSVYTTNLVPEGTQPAAQPFFITTGGYSAWYSETETIYNNVAAPNEKVDVNGTNQQNYNLRGFEILPSHIFDHCINLTEVTLPNDIKQLGTRCFNECKNLTKIDNYGNVIDFGSYVFAGCTSLKTFDLTRAKQKNNSEPYLSIIGVGTFMYCENLESVTMPNDIIYISGNVFAFCPKFNLNNGALPTELQRIGQYAFYTKRDKALTKVVLGEKLKSIDGFAFDAQYGSYNEVNVDFTNANNLVFIGYRAFADNHNMTFTLQDGDQLPNSIQQIDTYGFVNTAIKKVKLPVNEYYKTVNEASFGYNGQLETVEIPQNVTHIMNSAFINGEKARFTLYNKSSMVYIGASAFQNCKVVEGDFDGVTAVEEIGARGFEGCEKLTNASAEDLMKNLTVINEQTFANCTSLTELHLTSNTEKSLVRIDKEAFAGDRNVQLVKVYSSNVPTCYMSYYETVPVEGETTGEMESRYVDRNPFRGLAPNKVVLDFNGNYNENYRASQDNSEIEANTLGDAKGNGFLYLLTKYMRETGNQDSDYNLTIDGADVTYTEVASSEGKRRINPVSEEIAIYGSPKYNVVNQEHADVILERMVGLNWNTIMLPFTMDADRLAETFSGYNPVVAKYGWNSIYVKRQEGMTDEHKSVLQFETVSELSANTPYLFLLVNQAGGDTKTISTSTWNVHDVNIENNPQIAVGDEYTFTGSYDDQENIVSSEHGILYINSNSAFSYKNAGATTKTRMKGFRAYFTFTNPQAAGAKSLSVSNWDDFMVTGIDEVVVEEAIADIENDGPVYNLHGYKVADSRLALINHQLPKGIYIFNGEKVTVK